LKKKEEGPNKKDIGKVFLKGSEGTATPWLTGLFGTLELRVSGGKKGPRKER